MSETNEKKYHFVLVHGACHGAWCWYKLSTLLESRGHTVTAPDLAGCGIDPRTAGDVKSVLEYFEPLMDCFADEKIVGSGNRVVLVGHSFGGMGVSLAMERFPENIAVAVFTSAMVPGPNFSVAQVLNWFAARTPPESMLDSSLFFDRGPKNPPTSIIFGPNMLSLKLYQNCTPEDIKLAKLLVRPANIFTDEMSEGIKFTKERFGSVACAYVVCKDDMAVSENSQRFFIEKTPITEVKEIEGSDHMVMLSKTRELYDHLMVLAEKYA